MLSPVYFQVHFPRREGDSDLPSDGVIHQAEGRMSSYEIPSGPLLFMVKGSNEDLKIWLPCRRCSRKYGHSFLGFENKVM